MSEEVREIFNGIAKQFELHLKLAKEQNEIIQNLENKVNDLQRDVDMLNARVEVMCEVIADDLRRRF